MATKIPWTQETWNPVVGCTKIAEGCRNCYAEKMAYRLQCMGKYPYHDHPDLETVNKRGWTGLITCNEKVLDKPLHWKKPRKIFVCSMGDLFHEKVPFEFIYKVISTIELCKKHTFQILTKRPERLLKFHDWAKSHIGIVGSFPKNSWIGVSVSTQDDADKLIPILLKIPATVRFVSFEPALEEINFGRLENWVNCLKCRGGCEKHPYCATGTIKEKMIDWLIIGCESGPKARLCDIEVIRSAKRQAKEAGVPVFIKQAPVNGKCSKNPEKWQEDLRIQQYPIGRES